MDRICIYHGNCADGFGAAWAVWKSLGHHCEYYPGIYQQTPPDVTGKQVYLVDFSYKRSVLEAIAKDAHTVTILDHHKSAQEDLVPLLDAGVIQGEFDMHRSGAMMAWEYFHPGTNPPRLIEYIQDRDLWRFELPASRQVAAALFSYPYDFKIWDDLMSGGVDHLITDGMAIERKHWKDINELAGNAVFHTIGGHRVPMINCPYFFSSDMGHLLAAKHPFAACWWETPEGRVFSLRSRDDGADVSEIAKQYGGGGHRHAAGFTVPSDQIQQFLGGAA